MKISISWEDKIRGASPPKWYGFAYTDYARALDIYYPYLINWFVSYWRRAYWRFMKVFYWIGLIDIGKGEMFSWGDFFRIKTH